MTKTDAKHKFTAYLNAEHIQYRFLNKKGKITPFLEDAETIYLPCFVKDVIGGRIETSVWFWEEHCYCQSYYCQPVAMTEEKSIKAARICNYMNLHLHWDCNGLFEHNYYFNEDDGDLFNGCLIRYELLDAFFYEAMEHILNYSVQQIADVCMPVILFLEGKYTYENFKDYLGSHIIGK